MMRLAVSRGPKIRVPVDPGHLVAKHLPGCWAGQKQTPAPKVVGSLKTCVTDTVISSDIQIRYIQRDPQALFLTGNGQSNKISIWLRRGEIRNAGASRAVDTHILLMAALRDGAGAARKATGPADHLLSAGESMG